MREIERHFDAKMAPSGFSTASLGFIMQLGAWTWLETAKLFSGLLTPVALAVLGIYIHRITKKFEHLQWQNQKLIEKRLAVYDDLAPLLNDLLCYFSFVGGWKEMTPPDVIALKRKIDKKVFLASPLFTDDFFSACMALQSLCFETYTGWGNEPRLRTKFYRRKEACSNWQQEWEALFHDSAARPRDVRLAYKKIMEVFARDIGVHVPKKIRLHGHVSKYSEAEADEA